MNNVMRAVLAGLCFGAWPVFINRSGLGTNLASLACTAIPVLCALIALAYQGAGDLSQAKWAFALGAGVASTIGMFSFNAMLASVDPKRVSALFVVMILAQTSVPVINDLLMNSGKVPPSKLIGLPLAIVSLILLTV